MSERSGGGVEEDEHRSHIETNPNFAPFSLGTVGFPNPEEKGALEEAKSVCEDRGGDIILANDPDADRLAVAEKDRETNEWTVFHGNEIGVMLGHWLWTNRDKTSTKPVAMVASAVSSKMLRAIAEVEGFRFEETLTGFKWIGGRAKRASLDEDEHTRDESREMAADGYIHY